MHRFHYQLGRSPHFAQCERVWPPFKSSSAESTPILRRPSTSVLSLEEFTARLEHAQVAALRQAHSFSVLAYDVAEFGEDASPLDEFVRTLRTLLSATAEVGWLDENWLGILLPRTSLAVARSLESELRDELACVELDDTDDVPPARIHYFPPYQDLENDSESDALSSRPYGDLGINGPVGGQSDTGGDGDVALQTFPETRTVQALPLEPVAAVGLPHWKRALDLVGASLGLVLLLPLLLLVALVVKCTSRGPVLFRQERAGYLGRPFSIYKFRTMHTTVDTKSHQRYVSKLADGNSTLKKLSNDRDFVPLGKFLRKSAIDELPQLINVLRGEMSLVGPRPDVVPVCEYPLWQRARFNVPPGMTGWWQVNGKNRTTFNEMIQLDIEYVQRRSICFDLKILALTVPAILKQLGENGA